MKVYNNCKNYTANNTNNNYTRNNDNSNLINDNNTNGNAITTNTKRYAVEKIIKSYILVLVGCAVLLCGFMIDDSSSLKDLTHPYINVYECTEAHLGDVDLLENYDYFRITFLDENNLEVSFKRSDGKKYKYTCPYSVDNTTGEFTAEIGILGCKFKQTTKIENGKFTLSMPILYKQLIMKFAVK